MPIDPSQSRLSALVNGWSCHHIGFAVRSIEEFANPFAQSIGVHWDGNITHDPLQSARVAFVRQDVPGSPAWELIEPAGDRSPLGRFVAQGGGLHHVCYEVGSLDEQLRASRHLGGLVVKAPQRAVAFQGRRIAWVYTAQRLLLEFLER